jgi:hypothetical protein
MKFDDACSIAHNFADSFGSGSSLLFNFGTWPYPDAARSPDGVLEIDFLKGAVLSGVASTELRRHIANAPSLFSDFCERHGQPVQAFAAFTVRYVADGSSRYFDVTVQVDTGRGRTDRYSADGGRIAGGMDRT